MTDANANMRLSRKVKAQQREIEVLRSVVQTMWINSGWKVVKVRRGRKHLNNGKGTSYLGEETTEGVQTITATQQCNAVERALKGTYLEAGPDA